MIFTIYTKSKECNFIEKREIIGTNINIIRNNRGARRGDGGNITHPETEKGVVEKWCYFPAVYSRAPGR